MKRLFLVPVLLLLFLLLRTTSNAEENNVLKGKYIMVLDIQDIYTKEAMNAEAAKNLIDNVNKVVLLSDSDKVIYIESIEGMLELSLTGLSVQFKPGLNLDERLLVVNSNKFAKNESCAFTSEQLARFIEVKNAGDFVIVGLMAEHCVLETLLGGEKLGYNMYFIPGAIAGESDESKSAAFEMAIENGAEKIEFNKIM